MTLQRDDFPRRIGVAFACIAAIAAPMVWVAWFLRLFPLSEFRDWLVFFEEPSVVAQTVNNLLFRTTQYSRDFALLYVALISNTCVDSLVCINLLAALPLLLAASVFFCLVRGFTASTFLAGIAVLLWSLSTPYLDTMAWQVTILDRVGICFAMFAMLLAWHLPLARGLGSALSQAFVLCALTFASLNSKEAYWFVPIAVLFAYAGREYVAVRSETTANPGRIPWTVLVLAPMLIYSAWFAYRYSIAAPFADNWTQHVSSGGVLKNINAHSKSVFSLVHLRSRTNPIRLRVVFERFGSR
jgi:hypothetical protein